MTIAYSLGVLIPFLIPALIFGFISRNVVASKGYLPKDNHGFAWGFFLSWIGLIICVMKPPADGGSSSNNNVNRFFTAPPPQQGQNNYQQSYQKNYMKPTNFQQSYQPTYQSSYTPVSTHTEQEDLEQLNQLYDSGLISAEEYNDRKRQIKR
ncbi:MAG: SHOCT domain-containing protein [Ruminococcus sp.]|nr:SHOCT domain-containing protein [Ruminococcus sp.]